MPEYGHAGFVFPNVIYASFQIADAVMLVLGLRMLQGLKDLKKMAPAEAISFSATIVMTVFTQNIAYGAAAGCVVFGFMILAGLDKKEIASVSAPKYLMSLLSVLLLVTSLIMPTLGASGEAAGSAEGTETADGAAGSTENSSAFVFDSAAGDFSFTGNAEADYYTVWVYALDEEGQEGESYVAASSRLTGEGEISGNVDLSELPFGSYHANLIEFRSSGEASEPIVQEFTVSGKLSVPEFKYVQEGTSVTVTLCADTLSAYNDKEMFTDIDINIYDESGEAIQTETITEDDLTAVMMGPMTSYSCEKAITVEAGNYKISLTAKGDGDLAEASDESEQIDLEVADGGTSEGTTSGYTEPEGGPGGMMH